MKRVYSIIIVVAVFSSCSDFLEEDPPSQLVTEQFYRTEADAIAAINTVYEVLNSGNLFDGTVNLMNSVETDEATRGQFGSPTVDFFDQHEIAVDEPAIQGWWAENYEGINRANLAIANVPSITIIDEELQSRIIGEAKFLRALYYLNLVMAFGDVPLLTEPTSGLGGLNVTRDPASTVFNQIITDFTEAEAVLPETYSSANTGRPTLGAAKSMLARTYLYRGDFQNSRDKALEVMMLNRYELLADYADILLPSAKNGPEHIFSVQFLDGFEESDMQRLYGVNQVGVNPAIEIPDGARGQSAWSIEQDFFDDFPDTYRKRASFLPTLIPQADPDITDQVVIVDTFFIDPHTIKYFDPDKDGDNSSNNFNVIRYADVLLMFAEADNEVNGPTPEGIEALNTVRRRARGIGVLDASGNSVEDEPSVYPDINISQVTREALREVILEERKWELALEGLRRWDLLRTGRYLDELEGTTERNLLFPIPQREREINPNLTQNNGY
ncbi:MAG: RagB/SusD family nutrient uptake outer membrane protein [Bacteroidota bacterium]